MKKWIPVFLAVVFLLSSCSFTREIVEPVLSAPPTISSAQTTLSNRIVRLSVTQMLADSQMLPLLCERFEDATGYKTDISVNIDSVAVSVAETGKMDVLIAQKGSDADRFMNAGYASSSLDLLSGDVVLVGPEDDPASVRTAQTAAQALQRIANTESVFASRYDDSDVSRLETRLWAAAGVTIGNGKAWYKALRLSMAPSLQQADQLGAYILADRETFLQNADSLKLSIVLENVPAFKIGYCVLPVSASAFPAANVSGIEAFTQFLDEPDTQAFIRSFGESEYGQPIFTVNN